MSGRCGDDELTPTEEVCRRITAAADYADASRITNDVAYAAYKGRRPEADAVAARLAFSRRWDGEAGRQRIAGAETYYGTRD